MIRITKKKTNPTDHELLKKLSVIKYTNDNKYIDDIIYLIYINHKTYIGEAVYSKITNKIELVIVNDSYKRKGIASFIYDYIEKDQNVKLTPSNILLPPGKEFWKNRSRKQLLAVLKTRTNPTDKDFLSKVKIQKVLNKEYISYEAFYNNKYIAGVDFDPKTKTIWDVWVGPNYRRKGLATFIYNKIEKDQKIKLKPSDTLFPDGQEFWKNRIKKSA